MAISQGKSTRSPSGARNVANRGKRKSELGRDPAETRLDEKRLRKICRERKNQYLCTRNRAGRSMTYDWGMV